MKNLAFAVLAIALLIGAVSAYGWKLEADGGGQEPANGGTLGSGGNLGSGVQLGTQTGALGNAKGNYEQARTRYSDSLNAWKNAQKQVKDDKLQAGKTYAGNAVGLLKNMIGYAKEQISNSNSLTAAERARLEKQLKDREMELLEDESRISNSTNMTDLVNQARKVKAHWTQARENARSAMGMVSIRAIEEAIKLGWKAADRTDDMIEKCSQRGFDVSKAKADLANFENYLTLAEKEKNLASEYFSGNGTQNASAGFEHLKKAQAYLKDAKEVGKKLKDDLRECVLKRGHIGLVGSGWLHAKGTGRAEISGNGTVEANFSKGGKVTVLDRGGDASISVTGGNEIKDLNGTSGPAAVSVKYVRVRMFNGADGVKVTGSRITVILNAEDMELYAKGTGLAILSGTGTYEYGTNDNMTGITGTWRGNGAAVRISGNVEGENED